MKYFLNSAFTGFKFISLIFLLSNCSDLELSPTTTQANDLSIQSSSVSTSVTDCSSCTYVVPADVHLIDGAKLGLQPGSVIGLSANVEYGNLIFRNLEGTADNPIIIRNCGGTARINGTGLAYAVKTELSKYFRITGGDIHNVYGINIMGGRMGITLDKLSTHFEVDHVEVHDVGFAGIMAKTDPNCDDATIRGNFLMKNVNLHHNYIHDTGGEGFYVGNSLWDGMKRDCGIRLPHEIHNLRLNDNIVKNTGWDGIQVGCATRGTRIYGNTIENYGMLDVTHQNSGMQIGSGTGGFCYGNFIKKGTGNGLVVFGTADNVVYNNIIVNTGDFGIFCDERYIDGDGFTFLNNTIINPATDGIRIYANLVPNNVISNNIIVNPGSYYTYTYPRTPEDAFVYKLSKDLQVELTNNFFTTDIKAAKFIDYENDNYRLDVTSPLIDQGIDVDIAAYNIKQDYYRKARLKGAACDIGASEF